MSKVQILIVGDERMVSLCLESRLKKLGYSVPVMTTTGEDAIKKAKESNPDLVLMDIGLVDEMDGIEAAEIIRSRFKIPVIFLTTNADEEGFKRAKPTDPSGYILNPFQDRDLQNTIEMVLYTTKIDAERKGLEDALRKNEQRFREMADLLPNPICETDLNLHFTYVNNIGFKLFGFTQEDFDAGINGMDLIHPDDKEKAAKHIERTIEGEIIEAAEYTMLTKDGSELTTLVNASPIHEDEQVVGISINLTDITERKKMQEEILKARNLKSLGVLAGGIAHDFNNLLSVIMGNISLVADDIKPETGTSEKLKEAQKASLRAKELTARLITFSKGGKPVKNVVTIEDLVNDSVRFTLRDSNIGCKFYITDGLWPVKIDEEQIKQVIYNITANAREAMSGEGIINVYCENVTIREKGTLPLKDRKYVKTSIEDQGNGIAENNIHKIFDPYFSTKQAGADKGQGLGLSICHSIIEKHDGLIKVESKLGKGTTFFVYLPASEKKIVASKPAQKPIPKKPVTGTGRVLVMDDEEMIRTLASQMLRRLGYEVMLTADGTEAIELYKKAMDTGTPFDAVILDLTNKVGMGGVEAIKKLIQIDPEIKAIVASGYSNDPVLTNFREHGFRGALNKPHTMDELGNALHELISAPAPLPKK